MYLLDEEIHEHLPDLAGGQAGVGHFQRFSLSETR
jgi:hypothetical protein